MIPNYKFQQDPKQHELPPNRRYGSTHSPTYSLYLGVGKNQLTATWAHQSFIKNSKIRWTSCSCCPTQRYDLPHSQRKYNKILFLEIEAAKAKTLEEKKELNDENLDTFIEKLDADSMNDEADNKDLDEGQLKVYKLAKIYYDEGNF